MEEPRARRWCLAFLLLALLLAGLFLWSLNAGSLPLTPCEVWDILVRREGEYAAVIWKLRLPRTLAAALLALVGVVAEYTRIVPEWVMLILFLVAFFLYGYCIKRAWKVARLVKRIRRRIRRHSGNNPKLTK